MNPRQAFLLSRRQARHGHTVYDGGRSQVSFSLATQERVNELAAEWKVPRAEMVRFLVELALPIVEQFTEDEPG